MIQPKPQSIEQIRERIRKMSDAELRKHDREDTQFVISTTAVVNWSEGWLPARNPFLLRFRLSPRLSCPICLVEKFGNSVCEIPA